MFIKNRTDKEVKLRSFEGYRLLIPTGTSWIWDKAGQHCIDTYKVSGENGYYTMSPQGRVFITQPSPIPAIISGTEVDWENTGKRLAQVERFQVPFNLIPRKKLIALAKQRGVSDTLITEWLADDQIDASIIAEAINALPIPEEIRYPKTDESKTDDTNKENKI